jgi:glycerol-3-phosphate dehydrogenase
MLSRSAAVERLADEVFDVLVIGGGITGAGVALDAATRGYRVALVERGDFACGTSSRSSKLVHGGLRYLQGHDVALVRESLAERRINARLAPHLVRPLPFVMPAFDGKHPDRAVGVALNVYDLLGSTPRHRRIDGDEVLALAPALAGRRPTGGYLFHDCQTDDVRLVLTILGEAERFGAVVANRVEALGGGRVRDREGGGALEVRAAHVVNATGVWADRLLRGAAGAPTLRPSRGSHLILDPAALPLHAGTVVPAGERSIFVLPWLGRILVGTTDDDHDGALEHVAPAREDVAYLLGAVNAFFGTSLTRGDVAGAFAGVRPLVAGDARASADISRQAAIYEHGGMITITGGKLTTWRRMAKAAVDRIARGERPCRTHAIPLGIPVEAAALARVDGVPEPAYAQLAGRYGHAAHDVLALAPELPGTILEGMPDLLAEVVHAVRHEQARTVGDVLLRRTRLALTAARSLLASDAPERVAALIARELGGDARALAAAFRDEAHAEGILPAP